MSYGRFKKNKRPEGVPGEKKFLEALSDSLFYEVSRFGGVPLNLLASSPEHLKRLEAAAAASRAAGDCSKSLNTFANSQKSLINGFGINGKLCFPRDKSVRGVNGAYSPLGEVPAKITGGILRDKGLI